MKNSTVERLIYLYMALISQPLVDLPPTRCVNIRINTIMVNMLGFIVMITTIILMMIPGNGANI